VLILQSRVAEAATNLSRIGLPADSFWYSTSMPKRQSRGSSPASSNISQSSRGVSILALAISLSSLGLSVYATWQQHKQWHASSSAVIDVADAGFIFWRVVSHDEVAKLTHDFPLDAVPLTDTRKTTGELGIVTRLEAFDKAGNRIPTIPVFTLDEMKRELAAVGITSGNYDIQKHYRIEVTIQNIGSTTAEGFTADLGTMTKEGKWNSLASGLTPAMRLSAGKRVTRYVDGYGPPNTELPPISFTVRITYRTVDGELEQTDQTITYDRSTSSFVTADGAA